VSLKFDFELNADNISERDDDELSPPNTDNSFDESDSEDSDMGEEVDKFSDLDPLPLDIAVGPQMLPEEQRDAPDHIDHDGHETDHFDNPGHVHIPIHVDQPDHHQQNGVFIQKFTKGRPGAAVDGNGPGLSAQHDYHGKLRPNASGNVFAPFTSQMDWKFAKWAKSSGVSSTAITDLLAIEGVCSAMHSEWSNDATNLSRYGKASISPIRTLMSSTSSSTTNYPTNRVSFVKK
jgi:hypothetical protein